MPDIVTGKTFVDGEKGITATKLNQIISQAVIQPSFVTSKPSSSTLDPTDQMLEVKGAGTYATITGQQLIDSVSASVTQNITPSIWSVRLRSFNAAGNPTFEVDQRNADGSAAVTAADNVFPIDRWAIGKAGTMAASYQQNTASPPIVVPTTSFAITRKFLRVTLNTQQTTLGASDRLSLNQGIEGPVLRELISDVHSVSLLVRSNVAPLKFGLSISDPTGSRSLCKLCTISSVNTFLLLTFPNLPIFPSAGTFNLAPGNNGYILRIALAAGSSSTAPANDTWQNGNFIGALGQDNFAAQAVNSTFDLAFISHEPGAQCSNPPLDCPFGKNLDGEFGCQRYFYKSYQYATKPGSAVDLGSEAAYGVGTNTTYAKVKFPKTMAKAPSVLVYSPVSGTVNAARNLTLGGDATVTNTFFVGDSGFAAVQYNGTIAVNNILYYQYTSDTGW